MEPYQFDLEDYRRRLSGMTTPELEGYYRQIDPVELPQQWRAAVDELARRGIVTMPAQGSAYAAPGKGKSSVPLGVRIGCVGALFYMIFMAILTGYMFKSMPSMFPGSMSELTAMSGDGFLAINYEYSKTASFEEKVKSKHTAMIFSDGVWTALPAPPENGPMAWDGSTLHLLGPKGAYDLPFDAAGNPAKKWGGPVLFDSAPESCKFVFMYRGALYYLYSNYEGDEETNGVHLVDGAGKNVTGPLAEGFDAASCYMPFELGGKLLVFNSKYEGKSHKLVYKEFDGAAWAEEKTLAEGMAQLAMASDGKKIYVIYQKKPNMDKKQSPFQAMKEMQKTMGRLYGLSFDGKSKKELPMLKTKGLGSFDVAGDGKNLYVLSAEQGLESPDVYRLDGGTWKMAAKGAGKEFNLMPGPAGKLGVLSWLVLLPFVVIIVLISSRMILKERGGEVFIEGRTVKVPTLLRRAGAFGVDWALFYPGGQYLMTHMLTKAMSGSAIPDFTSPQLWLAYGILPLLGLSFFLYFFIMESFCGGQTLGKMLFKIRVVNQDLTPLKPGGAALRAILRLVDGIMFHYVAAVALAHTEKFQRIGDIAAKSIVIMDEQDGNNTEHNKQQL